MQTIWCRVSAAFILMLSVSTGTAAAPRDATPLNRGDRTSPAELWAQATVEAALSQLQADGDYTAAGQKLGAAFDALVIHADDGSLNAVSTIAAPLRLVTQLSTCDEPLRKALLPYLLQHRALADTIAITISAEDDVAGAYKVLDDLRRVDGAGLESQANLVAAICSVRDQPLEIIVAEDPANVPTPEQIYEYFTKAEKQLFFGLREMPPALLAYLVDTTTPVGEMAWALKKYRGNRQVGQRFFEIRYDDQAFLTGQRVRSRALGYTLAGILRNGGVCADQAYYAQAVGKSIGVPAAYCRGRSGEVGHAWVGFLERQPKGVRWNFDSGRYEDYKGQKGIVVDPQSRANIPDAYVALTAELATTSSVQRRLSTALTDAAVRLDAATTQPGVDDAKAFRDELAAAGVSVRATPRTRGVNEQLDLLNHAIDACPGQLRPWLEVARLAEDAKLTAEHKRVWTDRVLTVYSNRFPDLTIALIAPMIRSVTDAKEQDRLWNSIFRMFPNRADVLADIRLEQAILWGNEKQYAKASDYYFDVINRFAATGPQAVDALRGLEQLLVDAGQQGNILDLYARAWPKMQRSSTGARQFARQSNWYIVGEMYLDRLRLSGMTNQAESVRAQLDSAVLFDVND